MAFLRESASAQTEKYVLYVGKCQEGVELCFCEVVGRSDGIKNGLLECY